MSNIISEVEGFYKIVALDAFRETEGVSFKTIPSDYMPDLSSLDIVTHVGGAYSPGKVGAIERPWYMHPYQDDNLIVLQGARTVEIFESDHIMRKITVKNNSVQVDDVTIYTGSAMLVWFAGVYHRVRSEEEGSISINLAVHYKGFDAKTNFNIYDLDILNGRVDLLRIGELDQKAGL